MVIIYNKNLEYAMDYPVGENIQTNKKYIQAMVESFIEIDEFKDKYINIVCRGSSGAIIAGVFSILIPNNHRIIYINKTGEQSHLSEFNNLLKKSSEEQGAINIIVDDFICTGDTMRGIKSSIDKKQGETTHINCICVTGRGKFDDVDLGFKPDYFICGRD